MASGRLAGKVALVTGAARGQGAAEAELLAAEGAAVLLTDVLDAEGEETADRIRTAGGTASYRHLDVGSDEQWERVTAAAREELGPITVLVANAGVATRSSILETSEREWETGISVNQRGVFLGMRHCLPQMIEAGGGSIVNVSSIASLRYLNANYVAYYTTKAAVNHMTRVTACEYASRQVRINTVLPGQMDTPMAKKNAREWRGVREDQLEQAWRDRAAGIPMGWMGNAWDIARAALFFASDESRFVTGAELVVDGGTTLKS